jgi:hypothetical protein
MSHGLLLLRSGKTAKHPTRVDVLFQDVRALEVPAWMDGLIIEETTPAYTENRPSKPNKFIETGIKVYKLRGEEWEGYVIAGIVKVQEDNGELMTPSALM